ncbi:MAG: AraC family transcriptional regulator [Clostridia bacterium]|nr:AraC family transcriptional regulator [Clostridia bacterium]
MYSEVIINKNYEGVNPVQFGFESCQKSHGFGPAMRTYWLFHFVVSGKGIFQINDKRYELSSGMMFVIPPFTETYYEADSEDPWEYIWVAFIGTPPLQLNDFYDIPGALRIFQHMKASHNLHNGKTEFILAQLWELFSFLMEEDRTKEDPVNTALNLIHSQYMTPLTVQQMAESVHLERTYFSKIFSMKMGVSPQQYLIEHRMKQAKAFLSLGYSVTTTAISVGYSDIYIFSKIFKQRFGESPSRYQRNFKSHKKD